MTRVCVAMCGAGASWQHCIKFRLRRARACSKWVVGNAMSVGGGSRKVQPSWRPVVRAWPRTPDPRSCGPRANPARPLRPAGPRTARQRCQPPALHASPAGQGGGKPGSISRNAAFNALGYLHVADIQEGARLLTCRRQRRDVSARLE
jgi:hypothetical protein